MRIPTAYPCVECKGRKCHVYYGTAGCPWRARIRASILAKQAETRLKEEYEAYTTQPFIGKYGYPTVRLSLIQPVTAATPEEASAKDHPRMLAQQSLQEILRERLSALQPSWKRVRVTNTVSRAVTTLQAFALAKRPVLTAVTLREKPRISLTPLSSSPPIGMHAEAKRVEEAEHAQPLKPLEKIATDPYTPTREAVLRLQKQGVDAYRLTGVLSTGLLGTASRQRLVPTRWSITAIDDMLGRNAYETLIEQGEPGFLYAEGGFLGNEFIILIFKHEAYAYELIEYYTQSTRIMQDSEFFKPRNAYADETAGGYYAARLSILEGLAMHRLRGLILAIRLITPAYAFPLGVWVVREAARRAMRTAKSVSSREDLLARARARLAQLKPGLPLAFFLQQSCVWRFFSEQQSLRDYTTGKR